jgi:predicted acyltransferase
MSTLARTTHRLLSLDIFRGMTIAGMILVNSPGNGSAYELLDHSVWDGCTPADLVFPFFVFIMGVSIAFSFSQCIQRDIPFHTLFVKIIKRTAIIFILGLVLNGFPHYDLSTIRILGVLQRIAICYFFAAILFLKTRARTQILITGGLLIAYWLIMTWIPVPGYGVDNLTKEGNLAAYIDRLLLGAHTYRPSYDPEGILSTLPAIATALLGNFTGLWLLSKRTPQKKLQGILIASLLGLMTGWLWEFWFPINKALWTSSFVLWTGGLALFLLAFCYWLAEIKHWQWPLKPFEVFGMNALAAYFLHILFLKIQNLIHLPNSDGTMGNLRLYLTSHLFSWTSLPNAALLYAISYTLLWLAIMWMLYRFKIFIKI